MDQYLSWITQWLAYHDTGSSPVQDFMPRIWKMIKEYETRKLFIITKTKNYIFEEFPQNFTCGYQDIMCSYTAQR